MARRVQTLINVKEELFSIIKPFFGLSRNDYRKVEDLDTVVLHWTGYSIDESLNRVSDVIRANPATKGYHFLIDKNGKIFQGEPLIRKAAHAGESYGPRGWGVNRHSIGVSFQMTATDNTRDEFTEEMYQSCLDLILDLKEACPNLKYITGHHWISPRRRVDPYYFDFNSLIKDLRKKNKDFELWKTGYPPFPNDVGGGCKCIERTRNGACVKTSGKCVAPASLGWEWTGSYAPEAIASISAGQEESFLSDKYGENPFA